MTENTMEVSAPNPLHQGWEVRTLDGCVDFLDRQRVPLKQADRDEMAGDYPYYGASGIIDYIDRFLFDDDLILVGEDGDNLISRNLPLAFHISGKSWVNNHAHVLKPKNGFDIKFLTSRLEYFDYTLLISGSAQPKLSQRNLREMKLLIPPALEQEKIGEILSTLDRAIAQTQALIAKQQRIKTGLMQDLLTRGIDEQGNLRTEETHKFKDSPLGRIPVEWEPTQIGRIASLQRGHDITEEQLQNGPFPVISSSGVVGYHTQFTSEAPNVVVGRKGTIGKVHYLESNFWAHDTSLYVTNFWDNHALFVFYLFNYLDLARFGTKSGSPSLNRNDIHPLWIGRPSPNEQVDIANKLLESDQYAASLDVQASKIKRLKIALMQDLLTGRRTVAELLKSIKTN